MPAGRPTDYAPELTDEICRQLSLGVSLVRICLSDTMPDQSTVYRWLDKHAEFREKYEHARVLQAHTMADRAVDMATAGSRAITDPQVAAVQLNAIKWAASKLAPKVYGDKTQHEHSGNVTVTVQSFARLAAPKVIEGEVAEDE